jgi:hypothetical protein
MPSLLKQLPPPSRSKSGFPWTEESQAPTTPFEYRIYPKLSIVTPSYNQGEFIEETIRSVLLQNYPNLEYLIIDGGSTDNTLEILKCYAPWIHYWVSEPDQGQSDAINKGLQQTTGDIWAYMNSDDRYEPGTFHKVAAEFAADPALRWVTGYAEYVNETGDFVEAMIPTPFSNLKDTLILWEGPRSTAIQVSNFMSTQVLQQYGLFDEALHYCMDAEFGLRLLADGVVPKIIPEVLAKARLHGKSKTVSQGTTGAFTVEQMAIAQRFFPKLDQEARSYVEQKITECQFFTDLSKVAQLRGQPGFVQQTLSMLVQHPEYLRRRATWGMFRQAFSNW